MRPLQHFDPRTGRSTTVTTDSETGLPLIIRHQDTAPIVESAKRLARDHDRHNRGSVRHVARIPAVVWAQWARLGITNDEKALNALLEQPDCRHFRVDGGGRI